MRKIILFIVPVMMLLTACGGGSSSGTTTPPDNSTKTTTLGGLVSDPAVKDAVVELYLKSDDSVAVICGSTGSMMCRTITGEDGTFSLLVPEGTDLSAYYLKSYGGIDTETGVDLSSFSFESPVEAYSNNTTSIVVSPITTIMMAGEGSVADRIAHVKEVLGLDDTVNPLGDPAETSELFKRSYMLVSMAVTYRDMLDKSGESTADEAFKMISNASKNGSLIGRDGALVSGQVTTIYNSFSSNDGYSDDISELNEVAETVENISGSGNIVNAVVDATINRYFKHAVDRMVDGLVDEPSDTYIANRDSLISSLRSAGGDIPADKFVVSQVVRYAMLKDFGFSSYSDFTSTDFAANLTTMTSDSGFIGNIADIISAGPSNIVSIPLDEADLLGNDNSKRAAYYYNSNLDIAYRARKLASTVRDDEINDEIALAVVNNYSNVDLFSKAEAAANSLIVATMNKAEAYKDMGRIALNLGKETSLVVKYLSKAEDIVRGIHDANPEEPFSSDESEILTDVMQRYSVAGETAKAESVKTYIDDALSAMSESYKQTVYKKLLSKMRVVIVDMLESGSEKSAIESSIADMLTYVQALEPSSSTGRKYALHLVYLRYAIEFYHELGNTQKVLDTYNNYDIANKIAEDNVSGKTTWEAYAKYMVGPLYWAGAEDTATNLFNLLTKSSSKATAAEGLASVYYKDSMASAISIFETNIPMDDDYDNIDDYIDSWTYLASNDNNPGIAYYAILDNDNASAEAALDYIVGKMDAAYTYFTDNDLISDHLTDMVVGGNRYGEEGYVKAAYLYHLAGASAKFTTTIGKALAYTDASNSSIDKAKAYATIAYYHNKVDPSYDMSELFAKARAVVEDVEANIGNFKYKDLAKMQQGVAEDYKKIGELEASETALDDAVAYAEKIHPLDIEDGNSKYTSDKMASEKVVRLNGIAEDYSKLGKSAKAKATFEKAIASVADIESSKSVQTNYEYIMEGYAESGMFELGYAKAQVLFESSGDLLDGLKKLFSFMLKYDDFEDEDVAQFDMDKDGKPDFFSPDATAAEISASGLTLDTDTDGDGKADTVDATPFYAD